MIARSIAFLLGIGTLTACTGTNTEIRQVVPPPALVSALRGETVAVLPFQGPNAPNAQEAVTRVLVEGVGVKLAGPSLVDARLRSSAFGPARMMWPGLLNSRENLMCRDWYGEQSHNSLHTALIG
jgi:hypothetical protein